MTTPPPPPWDVLEEVRNIGRRAAQRGLELERSESMAGLAPAHRAIAVLVAAALEPFPREVQAGVIEAALSAIGGLAVTPASCGHRVVRTVRSPDGKDVMSMCLWCGLWVRGPVQGRDWEPMPEEEKR